MAGATPRDTIVVSADGTVAIAGLKIPATLIPRILAAARGLYPDLTAGKNDDAVVKAIVKFWITAMLSDWEARQALEPVTVEVDAVRDRFHQQSNDARQKAQTDASTIQETPSP